MLNFVLCDDNQVILDRLSKMLESIFIKHNFDAEIIFSSTVPENILDFIKENNNVHVLFLDIDLKSKMSGLDLASQIRKVNKQVYIIFTSAHLEYVLIAYQYKTFDFIPKPISEERLRVLFEKAGTYLNLTNQSFSFSYRRVRYSLKFDEILYLEKRGRQAIIHTKKMKYQSNMNLNEIWGKLDERMFAAVHGSFIVNLKHVHSVSSGMVMLTDGTELGVTRGYRKELTKKHIAFVQGGM